MAAMLNSFQMGFRSIALQKRSGEVWDTLSKVRDEFSKFGGVLEKTQLKMTQAQKEAAALADHGVTAAQSAVETTGSAQPTTSSAAPGDEYQRMLRDRR